MLPPSSSGTSLSPPPTLIEPSPDERRRWHERRWVRVLVVVAFLVGGLIASTFVVRVPYYAYSPGSLRPTPGLVQIEGAEVYPPEGEVLLTTVSVSRRRLTAWGAFLGWLDPTVTVVDEEVVVGPGLDREATRQFNLQLMTSSKEVATYVALDRLGYDVRLVGTGAVVVQVSEDTPADGVLEPGDTIVAVDGTPIELASELVEAISSRSPGDEVLLGVEPMEGDGVDERRVSLGQRDDDPEAAFLGVAPATRDGSFELPDEIEVEIQTNGVGGPSAGLTFTLTLLDLLTPGELTGGRTIAATGEIFVDGSIGPIGGVEQKAAAARRDGVDVFIVPASIPENELAAARRQAGDEVQIFEVSTLDEALGVLESLGGEPLPVPQPVG